MNKSSGVFLRELWHNQPAIVLGAALIILVFSGIYIFLLNTYK
tara:strand:+ start:112 stop:240 length:129 start_codon:yes stop_codon:yes gene_type:complete